MVAESKKKPGSVAKGLILFNTHLAGFLKTWSPSGPFASNSFFGQKQSRSSHCKSQKAQPLLFSLLLLSFSSLFSFSFPFPSLLWFWSLSGLRNLPDLTPFHWNDCKFSLGWFSKNRLGVCEEFCQSFKVCHFEVANDVSGHLALMLVILEDLLAAVAGFLKTYRQMVLLRPTVQFFRPKPISKVAIIKIKSATIAFFLFSSFLPPRCLFFSALLFLRQCDFGAYRA